jgi:hypothetical protein
VLALRQKRKEFVVVHDINQTVHHVRKFYHDNRVACTFVGEVPIQIAPTNEVEPKFRTPCKSLMNSLSRLSRTRSTQGKQYYFGILRSTLPDFYISLIMIS